jgi:RNA polymerase sigma-70 factor (ECF subfamily)
MRYRDMTDRDRAAEFASFYAATKDAVFRSVLLVRAGDAESAEDAVSEAFERALLRWDQLASHPNPTAWVIRTAINHRISMWRRHGRKVSSASQATYEQSDGLDPALLQRIRELPKGQREVLALRVLLDFSTEQTAATLGVKQGTVKKQLHRALEALRVQLLTHEPEEVWQ